MTWEGWFTLAVMSGALVALVRELFAPDLIFVVAIICIPLVWPFHPV